MFRLSTLKLKRTFYVLLLAFSFVLVAVPSLSSQFSKASLGACSDLGYNLDSGTGAPDTDVPAPDATGRKWTIQELFQNGTKLSVYNGETGSSTKGSWLLYDTKQDKRGSGYDGWDDQTVQTTLQAARSDSKCLTGGIVTSIGNMFYALSDWILDLGTSIVGQLYNPTFICAGGTDTNSCVINLVGVIGGSDNNADNGSLISSLYSGIYTPLISFSFLFVAIWLIYKGLIKRELRASFSGILWSIIIFFVGVISMVHPLMLASAPQQANSLIGSCIIGAMNGQNCMDGSTQAPSTVTGTDCQSSASGADSNQTAQLAVNGLGCAIWKSFVLDPWSASEFGRSYSSLYITNTPKGGHTWKIAKQIKNPNDYCVHLKSSAAASSQTNGVKIDGGPQVCNLAIYQLYLNSSVNDTQNSSTEKHPNQSIDDRYYNIIIPATKDPTMWNSWSPKTGNAAMRIMSSLMSFFSSTIAIISLVVFAFWGLIYEFAGTLLMAFAPVFFLVGVVPGNGKRIFLGWLESIVSSSLKYLASSLFVIIALTMYAGVVANAHSSGGAFIGILIMVGVMITYRKEIVNLLGQANFGGKRVSNAVGERIKEKAHKAKELGTATAGAGLGAAWGGRNNGNGVTKNFLNGAKSGAARRLKREPTILGSAIRQYGIQRNKDKPKEDPNIKKPDDDKPPTTPPNDGGGQGNGPQPPNGGNDKGSGGPTPPGANQLGKENLNKEHSLTPTPSKNINRDGNATGSLAGQPTRKDLTNNKVKSDTSSTPNVSSPTPQTSAPTQSVKKPVQTPPRTERQDLSNDSEQSVSSTPGPLPKLDEVQSHTDERVTEAKAKADEQVKQVSQKIKDTNTKINETNEKNKGSSKH